MLPDLLFKFLEIRDNYSAPSLGSICLGYKPGCTSVVLYHDERNLRELVAPRAWSMLMIDMTEDLISMPNYDNSVLRFKPLKKLSRVSGFRCPTDDTDMRI